MSTTDRTFYVVSYAAEHPSRYFDSLPEAREYAAEIGAVDVLDGDTGEPIVERPAAHAERVVGAILATIGGARA